MLTSASEGTTIVRSSDNASLLRLQNLTDKARAQVDLILSGDDAFKQRTGRLIAAGAMMASIRDNDAQAWDKHAALLNVKVKGANAEYRAIAGVIWSGQSSEPANRERISAYGKAICHAVKVQKREDFTEAKLARHISESGGLTGMIKLYNQGKHKGAKSERVTVRAREYTAVYVVDSDKRVFELDRQKHGDLIRAAIKAVS